MESWITLRRIYKTSSNSFLLCINKVKNGITCMHLHISFGIYITSTIIINTNCYFNCSLCLNICLEIYLLKSAPCSIPKFP